MLLATSIHSFEQLIGKIQQEFHMYNFQDVLMRINELRMKLEESLEDFILRFVHLCFEFPERDVNWVYLSENFQWLVIVFLQHIQFETYLDSHKNIDDLHITKCPYFTPNLVLPIPLNHEQTQASKEDITAFRISHAPPNLLHNNILAINGSDDEKFFPRTESNGFDSKALVHPFDLESEYYVDTTSLPTDGT